VTVINEAQNPSCWIKLPVVCDISSRIDRERTYRIVSALAAMNEDEDVDVDEEPQVS
jgi:hypothetical protein